MITKASAIAKPKVVRIERAITRLSLTTLESATLRPVAALLEKLGAGFGCPASSLTRNCSIDHSPFCSVMSVPHSRIQSKPVAMPFSTVTRDALQNVVTPVHTSLIVIQAHATSIALTREAQTER